MKVKDKYLLVRRVENVFKEKFVRAFVRVPPVIFDFYGLFIVFKETARLSSYWTGTCKEIVFPDTLIKRLKQDQY